MRKPVFLQGLIIQIVNLSWYFIFKPQLAFVDKKFMFVSVLVETQRTGFLVT